MGNFDKIAISGKMCSGKTTVANMLISEFDYVRMSFGDEVKFLCRDIANFNRIRNTNAPQAAKVALLKAISDDLDRITLNEKEYEDALTQVFAIMEEFSDVTYYDPMGSKKTDRIRDMLQKVGTDYMRRYVNDNIWVNAVEKKIKGFDGKIVVDDLRFPNEFEMLRNNGFVLIRLHVSREVQEQRLKKLYGRIEESKLNHPSETSLDYMMFDYVIDADVPANEMLDNIRKLIGGGK